MSPSCLSYVPLWCATPDYRPDCRCFTGAASSPGLQRPCHLQCHARCPTLPALHDALEHDVRHPGRPRERPDGAGRPADGTADYGVKTHGVYITSPIPYPPALFEVGGLFEKCPTDGSIPRPGTRRTAAFSSFGHAILNATSATTWTGTVTAQPVPRLRRGTRLLECSGSGIRRARLIRRVERIGPTVTMSSAYGVAVACALEGCRGLPRASDCGTMGRDLPMSLGVATGQRTTKPLCGREHPDFLDFANRQPAATVSSGCQGPIIRLQRQIGDTCGRTRAKATPGKRKRQPTAGSLHRIRRRSSCR